VLDPNVFFPNELPRQKARISLKFGLEAPANRGPSPGGRTDPPGPFPSPSLLPR